MAQKHPNNRKMRSMFRKTLFAATLFYFCAVSPTYGEPPAERTCEDLSIELVYKQPIYNPPGMSVPIGNAHLVGRGRILLESQDHELFMCDAVDGSILWRRSLRGLWQNADDLQASHKCILSAQYQESGVLGLVIVGAGDSAYLEYDHSSGSVQRFDLSNLMRANFGDVSRIPRQGSMILGVNGLFEEKSVDLIDPRTRTAVMSLKPKPAMHNITSLAFSRCGKYAAATGDSVYVWDLSTGQRLNDVYHPARPIIDEWRRESGGYRPTACAFSADGELLAVITAAGQLLVFETRTAKLQVLEEPPNGVFWGWVELLFFLGDTKYILGASDRMHVYDLGRRKWRTIEEFEGGPPLRGVGAVDVNEDSIYVCAYEGVLRRYDWTVSDN